VIELNNGEISEYTLTPCDVGLAEYPLDAIEGKGPEYNAKATLAILKGEGKPAHNAAIIANVAALLYLTNKADSFEQGAKIVADKLASGQTINTLNNIIKVSNKNVAEV
jgi:anthranilate phosphoribosyltransferase